MVRRPDCRDDDGPKGEVLTVILWLFYLLALFERFTILGPGAISYAGPGVLERVAERRVTNDWGLSADWTGYAVLVAPADCQLLGRSGWLITSGSILPALSVDCEQAAHAGQMDERGLLLDTNLEQLAHKEGWLILK